MLELNDRKRVSLIVQYNGNMHISPFSACPKMSLWTLSAELKMFVQVHVCTNLFVCYPSICTNDEESVLFFECAVHGS